MAYNQGGYGQQGQQGYGNYNPYGQSDNPYGRPQQGNPYSDQQAYGHQGNYSERPDLEHHSSSRYDEESGYEMGNMNGRDPNRILNEVRAIDGDIDRLEGSLQSLRNAQRQLLESPDFNMNSRQGQAMAQQSDDLMSTYRNLTRRVQGLKQDPESGNPRNKAQVGKVDRRLKTAINQAQQADKEFRSALREQIGRQYRIVRPDASEAEVQEAMDDTSNTQVFSQALISSDRRGEAQSVRTKVAARHQAIQKIEQDMMQLAELFNDLETMVVQQEPQVAKIEEQGEVATGHVAQANTELDGAVKKARAARRKKWYCLGIIVLVLVIIAIVLAVVFTRPGR